MKKGQGKYMWTPEEKAEIVHKHLNEYVSVRTLEKEYHADRGRYGEMHNCNAMVLPRYKLESEHCRL